MGIITGIITITILIFLIFLFIFWIFNKYIRTGFD